MVSKTLSIFIDESGDFGPFEPHAPYYAEENAFTRSEKEFFDNVRNFKKNYLKHIRKKTLQ